MTGCWTNVLRAAWMVFGVAVWPGPACAEPARTDGAPSEARSDTRPDTRLDLVTGPDFAPFTGEDLPNGGFLTELAQRAFQAAGRTHNVRFIPWKRGYDGVIAGRFLATFPYVRTIDRDRDALFSDPMIEVRQFVYLSTQSGMEFNGPADFRGRVVCAPTGYALPDALEALYRRGELARETPSSLEACVRMVASGRADAFVLDEYTGSTAVIQAGVIDNIRIAEKPYAIVSLHLIVGRGNPDAAAILKDFNAGLRMLKSGGAFDEMLARHTAVAPR